MSEAIAERVRLVIEQQGVPATLRRQNPDSFDVTTGDETDSAASTFSVKAVREDDRIVFRSGGTVPEGVKIYTISAKRLAITPEPGDQLVLGSDVFEIQSVDTKRAGGAAVAHRLMMRGGS